jgi:hypothetical protein
MAQRSSYMRNPFLIWIFANLLGFGALAASLIVLPSLMSIEGLVVSTFIISIPISLAQWIALRRIFPISPLWIFTIPIGLLLGILINKVIPDGLWQIVDDESTAVLTGLYLVMGFFIGLPQWLILRRQFSRSSIWLLGSSVGVALGFWLVLATDLINRSGIISAIVVVLVYVIATGIILLRLLSYYNIPKATVANTTQDWL